MTMIRQVLGIVVVARVCASLVLILVEGVSDLVQAAAFMIALIGLAPVALVIGGMTSGGPAGGAGRRALVGGKTQPVTTR